VSLRIRKADIRAAHRLRFERYGVHVVALLLAGVSNDPIYRGPPELQEIHLSAYREQRMEQSRAQGVSVEGATTLTPGATTDRKMHKSAAARLIENYDKDERAKRCSLIMEVAIVCLIVVEIYLMLHKPGCI
jgi:hypothetical protein